MKNNQWVIIICEYNIAVVLTLSDISFPKFIFIDVD